MSCRYACLIAFLSLLLIAPAWSQNDFEQAATALSEGRDQEALTASLRLDRAGEASFGSLYNEGLAYRNLSDVARARAAFERALLLDPHDLATRRQLRDIDNQLGEKVVARDVLGTPFWRQSEAEVLVILPGLALVILALAARARGKRPAPTALLALSLGGLGLGLLVALTSPAAERAVVVDGAAQLLPEPRPDKPLEKVPAGQLVEITERSDHYVKVRLGDSSSGWLRKAQLVELSPPPASPSPSASASPTP